MASDLFDPEQVEPIFARARRMSEAELAGLASKVSASAGFFGRRKPWMGAMRTLSLVAGERLGEQRTGEIGNQSLWAVLDAAFAHAQRRGRDVAEARRAVDRLRGTPWTPEADELVRSTHRVVEKGVGRKASHQAALAAVAIAAAATLKLLPPSAIAPADREILLRPWQQLGS